MLFASHGTPDLTFLPILLPAVSAPSNESRDGHFTPSRLMAFTLLQETILPLQTNKQGIQQIL